MSRSVTRRLRRATSPTSANDVLELTRERRGAVPVRGDHEARVVAGKRPDDQGMLDPVEGPRDCGRRAELRLDDHEILGRYGTKPERRKHCREGLTRVGAPPILRWDIARPTQLIARLFEAELPNVPGDRGLRRPAALGRQSGKEVVLRPDPAARDEAGDQPLALRLPERPRVRLHRTSIVIEPSRRFPARPAR